MSIRTKHQKSSYLQEEFAACDTWLSTAERKHVITHFRLALYNAGEADEWGIGAVIIQGVNVFL